MTMPAISSGELFFRTRGEVPGSWLHGSLGSELRQFLGVGTAEVNDKNFFAQKKMLSEAEELSLSCHRSMCRTLELHTVSAEQLCKSFLSRAKTTDSGVRHGMDELLQEYDDRCGLLALWYFAALEREQEIYRRRMEEESLSCNRLSLQVKESLRLSVFAIHLESETDSQILLKRLPPAHPQHVRCRRAASENIKPGYFDNSTPFSGINVLDVYKVENAPELDRFQKRAAAMEPGKVKGLFTSVTGSAIERIIALGMGKQDSGNQHLFRRAWYAYHNNKSEVGYAESRIRKAAVCQFPRSFSRYSTLEADRTAIEHAAELDRSGVRPPTSASSTTNKENEKKGSTLKSGSGSGSSSSSSSKGGGAPRDGGGEVNDDIRYLVLCRVAVGKVFVTSKEYRGFPSVGTDPAFDSMYNPLQEEYLVLRPEQVLPEFVIQFVLKKNSSTTSTSMTTSATSSSLAAASSSNDLSAGEIPVIPIDLSTPHVVLPPSDTCWRVSIDGATSADTGKSSGKSSGKSGEKSGTSLVAPTPISTPRPRIPTAWSTFDGTTSKSGKAAGGNASLDLPVDVSPVALAAEIMRREQLTSWEQLRLNAARQRETLLERCQGLHNTYKQLNTKLRVSCGMTWLLL